MKSLFPFRLFGTAPADTEALHSAPTDSVTPAPEALQETFAANTVHPVVASWREHQDALEESGSESTLLKTLGWITAGVGAVALGLVVGRELRQRYKFNRRTPYDLYAHAGDEGDMEFGVGI